MTDLNKILRKGSIFYAWVFLILAIGTPIYALLGVLAGYFSGNYGNAQSFLELLRAAGVFGFDTVSFVIWYKICRVISSEAGDLAKLIRNYKSTNTLSKLLYASFAADVVNKIYGSFLGPELRTDWSSVAFPSFDEHFPLFLLHLVQVLFKFTILGAGFLTPRVYGMAALALGICMHQLSRMAASSERGPNAGDMTLRNNDPARD